MWCRLDVQKCVGIGLSMVQLCGFGSWVWKVPRLVVAVGCPEMVGSGCHCCGSAVGLDQCGWVLVLSWDGSGSPEVVVVEEKVALSVMMGLPKGWGDWWCREVLLVGQKAGREMDALVVQKPGWHGELVVDCGMVHVDGDVVGPAVVHSSGWDVSVGADVAVVTVGIVSEWEEVVVVHVGAKGQ